MHIHCFQHIPYEGLGVIKTWCDVQGYKISYTRFFTEYKFPELEDIDMLIIMGGPMGVYDEKQFPWLIDEKLFIKNALDNGKKILGICLGAQLLAGVLGAKVFVNKEKEIGWFPIQYSDEAIDLDFCSASGGEDVVFHWHGDAFELPPNAQSIGKSAATDCQGFIYGDRVVALQYHLEMDKNSVLELLHYGKDELLRGKYIQSEKDIREAYSYFEYCHSALHKILDYLAS